MRHHLDHLVALDTTQAVLQLRRQRGEDGPLFLDRNNQLFNVPSLIVHRRRFVPEVEEGTDAAQPVPLSIAVGAREE